MRSGGGGHEHGAWADTQGQSWQSGRSVGPKVGVQGLGQCEPVLKDICAVSPTPAHSGAKPWSPFIPGLQPVTRYGHALTCQSPIAHPYSLLSRC